MPVIIGLVVSSTLAVIRQSLELPVAPKVHKRVISVPVVRQPTLATEHQTSMVDNRQIQTKPTPVPLPDLPEWDPPDNDNNDLILLDLD